MRASKVVDDNRRVGSAPQPMYVESLKRVKGWVDLEGATLEKAMREAASFAGGRLLDVGCGNKPYESLFAPHVLQYVGAEYSSTYDGSANGSLAKADVVYSSDTLPFEDGAFDTVLCNQVAEHVPNPDRFIADIVRVLRVGGRLILTVPFSFRVHSAPHDFHRFTRFALEHYAREHGLQIDVLRSRGGFWSVVGQKLCSRLALRGARIGGEIQKTGSLNYEEAMVEKPRYWAMPFAVPAIVGISTVARILDIVDFDDTDTLGYMLIATKVA